jgi:hypothetical protein
MLQDFERLLPAAEQRNAQIYKQRVKRNYRLTFSKIAIIY